MRILHIFDHSLPLHSGYSFRSRAILREQRRRGWETFHVTTPRHVKPGPALEDVGDGLSFYRTPMTRSRLTAFPVLREVAEIRQTTKKVAELVDKLKPDILHAHSPILTAIPALIVGGRTGIPTVYEIRATWEDAAVANGTTQAGSLRYNVTKWLETTVARRADAVACICQGLNTDLVSRGIDAQKVFVVQNAVDFDQFGQQPPKDEALARQIGLADAEVVGFLGSFYDYEGLDVLVAAAAKLRERRPRLKILLVGGGPAEASLRNQINSLNLSDRVILVGRVPQNEVNRYYSLVDVLAYPRLSSRLTDIVTPLKPLEAMASGKLVVASDVGGHKELIEPNVTGTLFPAGDVDALAQAIDDMFTHKEKWPQMRSAGMKFVQHRRTWANSIAQYEPVYRRLLGHSVR